MGARGTATCRPPGRAERDLLAKALHLRGGKGGRFALAGAALLGFQAHELLHALRRPAQRRPWQAGVSDLQHKRCPAHCWQADDAAP